jgi:hypothetical protein
VSPARAGAAIVLALVCAACTSPEARRTRGGGRGADVANRDPVVRMHAGSEMFFKTPCLLPEKPCTGPAQASGLPGDFPEPERKAEDRK